MDELDFLAEIRRRSSPPAGALGFLDDAAAVDGLVVTTDMLVEDVHFRSSWSAPEDVGWKAAAVNLSDLAAMGAVPVGMLWAVGVPEDRDEDALAVFDGLVKCGERYQAPLYGGDTVRAPVLVTSVTAFGRADQPVRRSGARPGEVVAVTGHVGGAAAGLAILRGLDVGIDPDVREVLLARHRRPEPRVDEASQLVEAGVAAMIDLSDGLGIDLGRLAESSGVRIEIEEVPLGEGVEAVAAGLGEDPDRFALAGGDDYELAFTVDPGHVTIVEQVNGIIVGTVVEGEGAWFEGDRVDGLGWRH